MTTSIVTIQETLKATMDIERMKRRSAMAQTATECATQMAISAAEQTDKTVDINILCMWAGDLMALMLDLEVTERLEPKHGGSDPAHSVGREI